MVNSDLAVPSYCAGCNNHHIGTLRCRKAGFSQLNRARWTGSEHADGETATVNLATNYGGATVDDECVIVMV